MAETDDRPDYPELTQGQIIPAFSLPGPDGMPHSPWDYKQRQHLLLIIAHSTTPQGRTLLQDFARHYRTLREERCALLAITAEPVITNAQTATELQLPFPLLADVPMRIIQRYTYCNTDSAQFIPCIVLADLYNAYYNRWVADDERQLPGLEEILDSLQYMNHLCRM